MLFDGDIKMRLRQMQEQQNKRAGQDALAGWQQVPNVALALEDRLREHQARKHGQALDVRHADRADRADTRAQASHEERLRVAGDRRTQPFASQATREVMLDNAEPAVFDQLFRDAQAAGFRGTREEWRVKVAEQTAAENARLMEANRSDPMTDATLEKLQAEIELLRAKASRKGKARGRPSKPGVDRGFRTDARAVYRQEVGALKRLQKLEADRVRLQRDRARAVERQEAARAKLFGSDQVDAEGRVIAEHDAALAALNSEIDSLLEGSAGLIGSIDGANRRFQERLDSGRLNIETPSMEVPALDLSGLRAPTTMPAAAGSSTTGEVEVTNPATGEVLRIPRADLPAAVSEGFVPVG